MSRLQTAIEENATITVLKNGAQVLETSVGRIKIVTPAGKLTAQGKKYYNSTGQVPQSGAFDPQRQLVRVKQREFVVFRDSKQRLARTWDPGLNDFKYTRLGKQYFTARGETEEYILNLPVTITGQNKKTGRPYSRQGFLPHQALGIGVLTVPTSLPQEDNFTRA